MKIHVSPSFGSILFLSPVTQLINVSPLVPNINTHLDNADNHDHVNRKEVMPRVFDAKYTVTADRKAGIVVVNAASTVGLETHRGITTEGKEVQIAAMIMSGRMGHSMDIDIDGNETEDGEDEDEGGYEDYLEDDCNEREIEKRGA